MVGQKKIKPKSPSLQKVSFLRGKVVDWTQYPLIVPTIKNLGEIELTQKVCFFVGENGSGKSTLLEAIAESCGFSKEGGSRDMMPVATSEKANAASTLSEFLRLSWSKKLHSGYFLRAESFFNIATYLDQLDEEDRRGFGSHGGISLHKQSHGESFLALFQNRFSSDGLYLLDEPEAALSPQRQLAFLAILHETVTNIPNCQFIIATHSPIILAYPGAQIFSFDNGQIKAVSYKQTEVYRVTHDFLSNPEMYLHHLLT
jgi:predicted ATPase